MEQEFIDMIAKVAHEAIRAHRDIVGAHPIFHWEALPKHDKIMRANAVTFFLKNPEVEYLLDDRNVEMQNDTKILKSVVMAFIRKSD